MNFSFEMIPSDPALSTRRQMAQISRASSNPKRTTHPLQRICWSRDDLVSALLLQQYAPISPSPLNPDTKEDRSIRRSRRAKAPTRKPPEVSPTLRLLRRKAAIAYKRSTERSLPLKKDPDTFIVPDICETSGDVADENLVDYDEEPLPAAFIVESGPLIQIVRFDCHLHQPIRDPEKQLQTDPSLFQRWQGSQQRLQLFFVMCLMSACFTFLTIVVLDSFRRGRYLAG